MVLSDEILELRRSIDEVDDQIVRLLRDREGIVRRITRAKREGGVDVYDPERELAIAARVGGGFAGFVFVKLVILFREAALSGAFDGGDPEPPA